jgi:hypothetical protein
MKTRICFGFCGLKAVRRPVAGSTFSQSALPSSGEMAAFGVTCSRGHGWIVLEIKEDWKTISQLP